MSFLKELPKARLEAEMLLTALGVCMETILLKDVKLLGLTTTSTLT